MKKIFNVGNNEIIEKIWHSNSELVKINSISSLKNKHKGITFIGIGFRTGKRFDASSKELYCHRYSDNKFLWSLKSDWNSINKNSIYSLYENKLLKIDFNGKILSITYLNDKYTWYYVDKYGDLLLGLGKESFKDRVFVMNRGKIEELALNIDIGHANLPTVHRLPNQDILIIEDVVIGKQVYILKNNILTQIIKDKSCESCNIEDFVISKTNVLLISRNFVRKEYFSGVYSVEKNECKWSKFKNDNALNCEYSYCVDAENKSEKFFKILLSNDKSVYVL